MLSLITPGEKKKKCKDPECNQWFTPKRKWQEFCTDKCRNNYHNSINNPKRKQNGTPV